MDQEGGEEEEGNEQSGGWQRATPSAWQPAYPSEEAEADPDMQIGTRDGGNDDQGLPEYDTTNMAAQQQELARLIGLIQQDPDDFMAGIGNGSIQITVPLTPDQVNILTQYVGVERAAQLEEVLGQMF